jgi:hypothetical protein
LYCMCTSSHPQCACLTQAQRSRVCASYFLILRFTIYLDSLVRRPQSFAQVAAYRDSLKWRIRLRCVTPTRVRVRHSPLIPSSTKSLTSNPPRNTPASCFIVILFVSRASNPVHARISFENARSRVPGQITDDQIPRGTLHWTAVAILLIHSGCTFA